MNRSILRLKISTGGRKTTQPVGRGHRQAQHRPEGQRHTPAGRASHRIRHLEEGLNMPTLECAMVLVIREDFGSVTVC